MRGPRAVPAILALLIATAGCTLVERDDGSSTDTSTQTPPGEEPIEECLSQTFTAEGRGHAAWIECRANVPGSNEQEMPCPEPGGAELTVKTNLTSGRLTVRIADDADETLLERTFGDTGDRPRNVSMDTDDARAGTWTLTAVREEGFDGEHRAELFCPDG